MELRGIGIKQIQAGVAASGIGKGDTVFAHVALSRFGRIAEARDSAHLASLFTDAMIDCIGTEGTLVVPTFTYSIMQGAVFDVQATPGTVGTLPEVFRHRPGVRRSAHPAFSVAALGPNAPYLTEGLDETCFGHDSTLGRLLPLDAKLLFVGADLESCTFIHVIEQDHGVNYRSVKPFTGIVRDNGRDREVTITFYARHLDRNVHTYLTRFQEFLVKSGLMAEVQVGEGFVRMIPVRRLYDVGMQKLREDPFYFLKEPPTA